MNCLRPAYFLVCLCLTAVTLSAPILPAQTATAPDMAAQLTPSELYRDAKVLRVVARLELTRSQIEKVLPVVQTIADQIVADRQADDHDYELVRGAAGAVTAALTYGRQPPAKEMALLDKAAADRTAREDFRAGLAANAASQIQRMLTADQASRIETAAEQTERQAAEERLEGEASPLDYVIAKLNEQMELMPDEYLRTREERAWDMARALLGEDSPRTRVLAAQLLTIMNRVASWTPEEYEKQRPDLREDITKELGLEEKPGREILYDDFIAWITSERTPPVLRELLTVRQPEEEGVTP